MITVVVLGAKGMVGREVYKYLSLASEIKVYGTTRKINNQADNLLFFDARSCEKDFIKIFAKIKKIDYIINCIGILNETNSISELIYCNSLFPHLLEEI